MLDRRFLRTLVLVALLAMTLVGGAVASNAQPVEPPGEVEQPLLASASADCHNGKASVTVWIDDAPEPWTVQLVGVGNETEPRSQESTFDDDRGLYQAVFDNVPVGEYAVAIVGADRPSDGLRVLVKDCADVDPPAGRLDVEVECRGGWGIATFVVTNPTTGETSRHTLTIGGISEFIILPLGPGEFVRISQNLYDDGKYLAELLDDETVLASKGFTVSCRSGNPARLDVTATCVEQAGRVTVGLYNPNRAPVDYAVVLGSTRKTVRVGGGLRGTTTFSGVADGRHAIVVTGGDETTARIEVTVDCVTETTTPTSTTTTTTTTTATSTATGTTTPAPQGRADDDLARTGASVGGLVGIGALVLALGGLLAMVGRRRRAHQD